MRKYRHVIDEELGSRDYHLISRLQSGRYGVGISYSLAEGYGDLAGGEVPVLLLRQEDEGLPSLPRHGENWDYLAGKPGVWLVEPDDERGMQAVVAELAEAKAAGAARAFDRSALRGELSYDGRAGELAGVIREGIDRGEAPRR